MRRQHCDLFPYQLDVIEFLNADGGRLPVHVKAAAVQAVEGMERDGEALDPEKVWAATVLLCGDPGAGELNEKPESLDAPFRVATRH